MSPVTKIDDQVFTESWEAVFQRVFGACDGSAWAFWQKDREPMPVAWRFVPMSYDDGRLKIDGRAGSREGRPTLSVLVPGAAPKRRNYEIKWRYE